MYFITTKRMLEVCFSVHPNIQYRTIKCAVQGRPCMIAQPAMHGCLWMFILIMSGIMSCCLLLFLLLLV